MEWLESILCQNSEFRRCRQYCFCWRWPKLVEVNGKSLCEHLKRKKQHSRLTFVAQKTAPTHCSHLEKKKREKMHCAHPRFLNQLLLFSSAVFLLLFLSVISFFFFPCSRLQSVILLMWWCSRLFSDEDSSIILTQLY
mgnify:CR=1 FL=1